MGKSQVDFNKRGSKGKIEDYIPEQNAQRLQQISVSDAHAIHDDVNGEINALTVKTPIVDADVILIEDSADSYAKKKALLSTIILDAIKKDVDGEINALTVKTPIVDADVILIEDSADSYAKKKALLSTIILDAIKKDVANEITAIAEKTVPAANDEFLIEDSAASFIKKSIKLSNLISDLVFGSEWGAITTIAPSKKAIYDAITLRCRMATGTYTGDGANNRQITGFGFTPKSMIVYRLDWANFWYKDDNMNLWWAVRVGVNYDNVVKFIADGFELDNGDDTINSSGRTYTYTILG